MTTKGKLALKIDKMIAVGMTVLAMSGAAALEVNVVKAGSEKVTVTIQAGGNAWYLKCLKRNLELSGYFKIGPSGTITVSGTAGGAISATGRGKTISSQEAFSGDAGARMAARRFSDAMVKAFSEGGMGFATSRLAYVNRKGSNNAELYMCYPDGWDMRQLTSDGRAAVGPRWAPNGKELYYTGFLHEKQLVYRLDVETGKRECLGLFKNGASGAAVSPDGRSLAIILSYQGNPELYVMDLASRTLKRMTKTAAAAESSPCWSPDGSKIAYVSDQTRNPQIYICDVANRTSVRYTSKGRQNTHPDWSKDGKLCWSSLQAGQWCVMVSEPNAGESKARIVAESGTWQDPTWAADSRHIVASKDKALFMVDSDPDGDKPVQIFYNQGAHHHRRAQPDGDKPVQIFYNTVNCMNPALSK